MRRSGRLGAVPVARRRVTQSQEPTYPEVPEKLRRCYVEDWVAEDYAVPSHFGQMTQAELIDVLRVHAWNAWREACRSWWSEHAVSSEVRRKLIPASAPVFRNYRAFEAEASGRFEGVIKRDRSRR